MTPTDSEPTEPEASEVTAADEFPTVESDGDTVEPVEVGDIEPSAAELVAETPADEAPADVADLTDTETPDRATDDPSIEAADELPGIAARLVDPADLAGAIEAILFVLDSPVSVATLAASLQQTADAVHTALTTLRTSYDERSAGFELREVAGGVRLFTRPQHADVVEHFLQDGQRTRLTQAALETLAVIAYRQPVTRARVSATRGVNVDGVVRTLLARGLIVEVGTDEETGGGQFGTSELFLEKMGLRALDELPSLAPLLPDIEGLDSVTADE